ncbi:MAG: ATP-binding protein [Candidatus Zixiibacteriota bacterium]
MNSSFGKKLFRLFLLFALIPATVLALTGYFLSSESRLASGGAKAARVTDLAGYYNDFLYARIKLQLEKSMWTARDTVGGLDFLLRFDDPGHKMLFSRTPLSDTLIEKLVASSRDVSSGIVSDGQTYVQFCRFDEGDTFSVLGGIIHGPGYAELLRQVQTSQSSVAIEQDLISNYILFAALVLVVIGIITAVAAYYFSARMSQNLASPLIRLSEASKKIAAGDFDQSITTTGAGEIAMLVENFNAMARQLKTTTARLAQTERVAAWRNIARRFAHELKNPLQPIMVSLYRIEKIMEGSEHYERLREPLKAASEEIKHLSQLADRFSQLAKLPPPNLERASLNSLLSTTAKLYEEMLSGFNFRLELPTEDIVAKVDTTYFREVMNNLLQNSVDASTEGATIVLKLSVSGDKAIVEVRDCGKGMSAEIMASARIPYFTTKEKGSGLGLAIVEKVVSEMSGDLSIESIVGAGTTVRVSIPLGRSDG